ncbi:MAG: glycoside hydrolase family 25 protein [Actinobacteria bacterium]|nr:glycoside hydrolase family 25 protein [Actinomycetota bacterium]
MRRNFKLIFFIAPMIIAYSLNLGSAQGATSSLTFSLVQTPSVNEPTITLFGQLRPARSGVKIAIQVELDSKWQNSQLSTKTTSAGTWKIEKTSTAQSALVKYRAVASTPIRSTISATRSIRIKSQPSMSNADPTSLIAEAGPGGRIHGMDISRWQHPANAPIDFAKMYSAGIRFVMIKASDTKDSSDAQALKYVAIDHNSAQAAGIYTGFYHYATLPDSSDPVIVIEDAHAQAQKVIWRLASLGGYTERDLSYALDLENNCVRVSASGSCIKYTSRALITLWAQTWLQDVEAKTGRTPILYSYPQFLENAMVRNIDFAKYPLWVAHYGINPADPLAQPGLKNIGCFVHSWTTSDCTSLWTMWQYTSCGIANKYGVSGTRVDLNVFRGTPSTFLNLMKGTWVPEVADLMPVNEPTQISILKSTFSSTDKPVIFAVDVVRPSGNPVVTGTVKFVADPLTPIPVPIRQSAVRSSSGSWTLSVSGAPAGAWSGQIVFTDISGTHATSSVPITFILTQGPTPTPTPTITSTPTPTPTKTATPKPVVDSCKNQIKN